MNADVVHSFLSHDPVVWITTLSGIAATWTIAYFTAIRPAHRQHAEHEAHKDAELKAEQQRMGARWNIIDGMAGVPGMYGDVAPLALRLRTMEDEIAELKARK